MTHLQAPGLLFLRARHALTALALLAASPFAQAQATRTWVSGVGHDANPCSRAAPCRSFAGALSKTATGGEISVLDVGVFDFLYGNNGTSDTVTYAPLVINKPITISGAAGRVSGLGPLAPEVDVPGSLSVTVAGQQDAIVIDLPPGALGPVTLRNLSLNGAGGLGRNGIRIASASTVSLQNVDVAHFSQNCLGVDATASGALVDVADSTFAHCTSGVAAQGDVQVNLGDSAVVMNTGTGVVTTTPQARVYTAGSTVAGNAQNVSLQSFTAATPALAGGPGVPAVAAGSASAVISGGAPGCAFASQQFVAQAAVGSGLPQGAQAAQAAFRFLTTPCGALATVTVTLTYSQALPAGAVLYKFGPATPGAATSRWFPLPGASLSPDRKTFTYSVTDNGVGDSDNTLGVISDPVLPVVLAAAGAAHSIPTLSEYGLMLLTALMGLAGWAVTRRRTTGLGNA